MRFDVAEKPAPELMDRIYAGLGEHSREAAGAAWQPLSVMAFGEDGVLRGGVVASHAGGCLLVKLLWVDKSARGQSLGRALMERIEREAAVKNCTYAMVDTLSYQAPDFYRKLGYRVIATIADFLDGHDRVFFRKDF